VDIGCGWGGLAKFLVQKYGVKVVGVTISVEGAKGAREMCKGLEDSVEFRVMDYRDLLKPRGQGHGDDEVIEQFERVVSVGLLEHVGASNYRTFFQLARRILKDDGLFLLHSIAKDSPDLRTTEPWTCTYIFPGGAFPTPQKIASALDGLFILEDWHNMSFDYNLTLMAWHSNFLRNWPTLQSSLKNVEDPQKFFRMWTFYLLLSAAIFRFEWMDFFKTPHHHHLLLQFL
jgi:cyclopropane-fatty-acyl-phospholipid synthase